MLKVKIAGDSLGTAYDIESVIPINISSRLESEAR
jgi:hypothetical protein